MVNATCLIVGVDCAGKDRVARTIKKLSEEDVTIKSFASEMTGAYPNIDNKDCPPEGDILHNLPLETRRSLQLFAAAKFSVQVRYDRLITGQLIVDDEDCFVPGVVEIESMVNLMGIDLIVFISAEPNDIGARRKDFTPPRPRANGNLKRINVHQEMEKRVAANIAINNNIRFEHVHNSNKDDTNKDDNGTFLEKQCTNILNLIEKIKSEKSGLNTLEKIDNTEGD